MAQKETGVKLSQSAPIMPSKASCPAETYGVAQPVSAATIPSVYNKKLNKLFRGRLVVLPSETSVSEALKRMARYNISSVPVTKGDSVLGFVDTLDFLAYLVKLGGKDFEKSGKLDVDMLKNKTQLFKDAKIGDLVDQSGRDPFHILHGDASLSDAVEQYLKGSHRVAISDDNGGIIGVVSQWTIANYLATVPTDEKEWIPTLRESLSKVQYTKNVFSVSKDERVLDAFVKMHHHKVSALAVLDGSGKLVGNLSASDLKGFQLFLEDFNDLVQTVEQFLNIVRKKQMRKENFVVVVTEDTPVKDIVTKFNDEIIHRVFVVDNQFKPIGVFSLTDLMKILIVDTHSISTFAKPTAISQ